VTRTEDRLTDALGAVAARIPDESLPPLTASRRPTALRWERAARWLVPVAVAAAVLAVIAGVALVVPGIGSAGPFADLGTRSSPPPYYVSVDDSDRIVVHSTASGAMTDAIPQPRWLSGGNFVDTAIAASESGRTFVAAMNDWDSLRTRLYRFSLTSDGKISGLTALPAKIHGMTGLSAALSPDGSELALAGVPDLTTGVLPSDGPPRIQVVNLKTGRVRSWSLPSRPADDYLVQDPAWSAGGRELRFLVSFCSLGRVVEDNVGGCTADGAAGHEWVLPVPAGHAPLGRGRSTATLPGGTSQAVPVPGNELVVSRVTRAGVVVARYSMTGELIRTLYRGNRGTADFSAAYLSVDVSGRYVILTEDRSSVFGWVIGGRLRTLGTRGPFGFDEMLATAW
jgi:hypothetical protein